MAGKIQMPQFQLQKVYADGSREEPQLYELKDMDTDCRMGRRGFLVTSAIGIGTLGLLSAGCAETPNQQSPSSGIPETVPPLKEQNPSNGTSSAVPSAKKQNSAQGSSGTGKPEVAPKSSTAKQNPDKPAAPSKPGPVSAPGRPSSTGGVSGGTICRCNKICTCIPIK